MTKVIGVITARMSSTRLPGKVMEKFAGKSMFEHHVERMRKVMGLDGVFLATSKDRLNRELIKEAERLDCGWYAGAEQDVVDRHIKLCEREEADAVVRITCDSPLFDIDSSSIFVEEFKKEYHDYIYVSNMTMIQGTLAELISYNALLKVHRHYKGPAVTMYIVENMSEFKTSEIKVDMDLCRPEYRLTVDYPVDLDLIRLIYEALYRGEPLSLRDVYSWLDDNPQIAQINKDVVVKGVNLYFASLTDKLLYSIVASGRKHVILDEQKQVIDPREFIGTLLEWFPELKK